MVVNIEVAFKIEEMKKNGASDREVGQALGLSERAVLYTRKALGIPNRCSKFGKVIMVRVFDLDGKLVAEGTVGKVAKKLGYTKGAVMYWESAKNPPYRVERVE